MMVRMTELDATDLRIIEELRKDGRATAVELAKRLGLPRTTVVRRLHQLEASKTILGYGVRVDERKLGNSVKAFIMIGFQPSAGMDQRQVARRVASLQGVEEVSIISGEWDILVKLWAPTLEDVGNLVLDKIRREPGVARTLTFASFASIRG